MNDNSNISGGRDLQRLIQEQLRQTDNRRHLWRMPLFRAEHGSNDQFDDLLARLDIAEAQRSN